MRNAGHSRMGREILQRRMEIHVSTVVHGEVLHRVRFPMVSPKGQI